MSLTFININTFEKCITECEASIAVYMLAMSSVGRQIVSLRTLCYATRRPRDVNVYVSVWNVNVYVSVMVVDIDIDVLLNDTLCDVLVRQTGRADNIATDRADSTIAI